LHPHGADDARALSSGVRHLSLSPPHLSYRFLAKCSHCRAVVVDHRHYAQVWSQVSAASGNGREAAAAAAVFANKL